MDPIITTEFIKAWSAYGAFLLLLIGAIAVLWKTLRSCDEENRKAMIESTRVIAELNTTIRLNTETMEARNRTADEQSRLIMAQSARLEALEVATSNNRETARQHFEQLQKDVGKGLRR